jgi:hypothetical protein
MTANFFFKNLTPQVTEGENIQLEITRTGDLTEQVTFFASSVYAGAAPALTADAVDVEWADPSGGKVITFQPGSTKEIVSLATFRDGLQENTEFSAVTFVPHYYYGPDMWARRYDIPSSPTLTTAILDADTLTVAPEPVVEPTPVVGPEPTPAPTPSINNSYNTYNTYNYTYNFTDNSVNTDNSVTTTTTTTDNSVQNFTFSWAFPVWDEALKGTRSADQIIGTEVNDKITGSGGTDLLAGAEGDDYLIGGSGGDTLDGGVGANTYLGGSGADTYRVYMDGQADVIRGVTSNESLEVMGFDGTLSIEKIKGGWGLMAEDMMVAAVAGTSTVFKSILTDIAGL